MRMRLSSFPRHPVPEQRHQPDLSYGKSVPHPLRGRLRPFPGGLRRAESPAGGSLQRQQQEISELQDFVARNKARVSTRNMAMSRQKKLDKMEKIELAAERPKPEFHFQEARAAGKILFETKDLVIGYDEPAVPPLNLSMERSQKIALVGANGIGKTTLLKSIRSHPAPVRPGALGDYLYIGYFEQEMAPGNTTTCIEELWKEFPTAVPDPLRPGKSAASPQAHREPGARLKRRRAGQGPAVQAHQPGNQPPAAGRAHQSPGCGRQRRAEAGAEGIQGKYPAHLP